ncbi:MAG: YybS family protein [Acidaminococcaceae bacterium]|nr:YybS family protein [Acidaminococcaceae bacterium]
MEDVVAFTYRRKTSAMVESAICAAIAIVFNLLFAYVPFMGIILNLIMPLPLVVCGMRNGLRWSIMSSVVSTILVAMTVNPIHALFYIGVYCVMGIVLGECMHRHLPAKKLLVYASIGALVSIGINMFLALYVMGIHPVDMMFQSLDDAIPQIAASFNTGGMTPEQAAAFTAQMTEMVSMIKIILPGAMLLMAPILVMINYWAARRILARTGETFPEFPPTEEWSFPPVVALVYVAALFVIQYFQNDRSHIAYTVAANVWAICSMLLLVQGLVFAYWYIKKHNKPIWWFKVLVPLSMFISLVGLLMTYVGGYDILFDARRLRSKKYEAEREKKKMSGKGDKK